VISNSLFSNQVLFPLIARIARERMRVLI
jgi:hypothetical protein